SSRRYMTLARSAGPSGSLLRLRIKHIRAIAAGSVNNTPPTTNVHQGAGSKTPLGRPLLKVFRIVTGVYQCSAAGAAAALEEGLAKWNFGAYNASRIRPLASHGV